jgi:hypothetical protein
MEFINNQERNYITNFATILESGYWEEFCSKYGFSEYAIAEGMDSQEETIISGEDAKEWGLLDNK